MPGLPSISGAFAYPLLFALVLGESGGLPLPGESTIMVAAMSAADGSLSIYVVLGVAIAAAILGDNLGYLAGRRFGRRIWTAGRFGRARRERWLGETEAFFDDHAATAVVAARWLPVARFTVAWMAGIHRMPWRRFVVFNAAGGVSWVLTIGLAAFLIGQAAKNAITGLGLIGLVGLVLGVAGHLLWKRHTAGGDALSRPRKGRRSGRGGVSSGAKPPAARPPGG